MKFVFFTMPARAHVNPTLGIVKELVKLKHDVLVYSTPEFTKEIEDAGAQFRSPVINLPDFRADIGKDFLTFAEFLIDAASGLVDPMIVEIKKEKPDCVVHDSLNVLGKVVAAKIGLPAVCLVPTFVLTQKVLISSCTYLYPDYVRVIRQPFKILRILRKYRSLYSNVNLKPPFIHDVFINRENLNIVFTSRFLQPGGEKFGHDYQFIGPIMYNRADQKNMLELDKVSKPIIYISLGTLYNNQMEFYKNWISFFRNTAYQVYMSVGKDINRKDLGDIPKNIVAESYLPQLEILRKSAVFISHGGMNSINESLYYGVPMLLFPQIHEQKINSARVEKLGAGIWCKQAIQDEKSMKALMDTIMTEHSYKTNALKIGKTLKDAGGARQAVRSILEYLV